jgi:hypothetical protein
MNIGAGVAAPNERNAAAGDRESSTAQRFPWRRAHLSEYLAAGRAARRSSHSHVGDASRAVAPQASVR